MLATELAVYGGRRDPSRGHGDLVGMAMGLKFDDYTALTSRPLVSTQYGLHAQ